MELPEQIKANRKRLALSQEDVARRIFVSRQTMSSWETGKTYPDVQSLLLLSNLFGVSIDELVKGDMETMKDTISKDALKMERLTWLEIFLIVFGVINAALFSWRYQEDMNGVLPFVGLLISLAFLGGGLVCALKIDRIKKRHDLVSFKEILAFSNGEDVENLKATTPVPLSRKHPALNVVLKLLAGAAAGVSLVVLGRFIIFWLN